MALRTPPTDTDSDYGSDFYPEDLEVLDHLVVQTPSTVDTQSARRDAHPARSRYVASMPIAYETNPRAPPPGRNSAYPSGQNGAIYPDLSAALSSLNEPTATAPHPEAPPPEAPVSDTRSPLQRYRSAPRKALSVTDLVSPAWCELQYSMTLAMHGRKPRTEAMKRGSEVHAALEEEVYTSVQIEVATKEDAWG
ncbi:hypothetical protein VE00_10106 [Pseudogymnoascus sp. WSF 3629]|nr:hypothetical protein VE00_10106 [Pseudogymnoascus sp. WSF 3629]